MLEENEIDVLCMQETEITILFEGFLKTLLEFKMYNMCNNLSLNKYIELNKTELNWAFSIHQKKAAREKGIEARENKKRVTKKVCLL